MTGPTVNWVSVGAPCHAGPGHTAALHRGAFGWLCGPCWRRIRKPPSERLTLVGLWVRNGSGERRGW